MNYEQITLQTCKLTNSVGEFIKGESGKITAERVETKGLHDFVTYVDKQAEKKLVAGLKKNKNYFDLGTGYFQTSKFFLKSSGFLLLSQSPTIIISLSFTL